MLSVGSGLLPSETVGVLGRVLDRTEYWQLLETPGGKIRLKKLITQNWDEVVRQLQYHLDHQ